VLLNYSSPQSDWEDPMGSPPVPAAPNAYRAALSRLKAPAEFGLLMDGFCRLLSNPHAAENTWLPNSQIGLQNQEEMLVLFWHCAEGNRAFRAYACSQGAGPSRINRITATVLYFLAHNRKVEAKVGQLHICVFILLLLSGERQWAIGLNEAYPGDMRIDVPDFTGCYADLLLLVFQVRPSSDSLSSLFVRNAY